MRPLPNWPSPCASPCKRKGRPGRHPCGRRPVDNPAHRGRNGRCPWRDHHGHRPEGNREGQPTEL
ncbi:hypothetical protein BN2537_13919 [Streptomyces venezuelae]|nr:hypothetical protein BN2537_13919 [Streptomyces venezuelae]